MFTSDYFTEYYFPDRYFPSEINFNTGPVSAIIPYTDIELFNLTLNRELTFSVSIDTVITYNNIINQTVTMDAKI